jgi:F-type H+-transporting ATPase subunit b
MDLNATILCEFLIFALFYGIVQKKIWPGFRQILNQRQAHISAGLESAVKGHKTLEDARQQAAAILKEAMSEAQKILDQAQENATRLNEGAIEEINQLRIAAQKQAIEEHDNLKKKFLIEAKSHYVEIASAMCSFVLNNPENDANNKALFQQALVKLNSV